MNQPILYWFDFVLVSKTNGTKLYTFFYLVIRITFTFKTELNPTAKHMRDN